MRPLPHLWHLLSLDAPAVAALWTYFIARTTHTPLPSLAPIAMALAVWMLYAADRILDAQRHIQSQDAQRGNKLEARHLFHARHRTAFLIGIALAAIALAAILPTLAPAALRIYSALGILLAAYFILIHATRTGQRLPKELAVGSFFSAAVFIPSIARSPQLRLALLPFALHLALVCWLNCIAIYAWENPTYTQAHATTRWAVAHLQSLAAFAIALAFTLIRSPFHNLALAAALSAATLLILHRNQRHLSRLNLRVLADAALLTPLLFLPLT